MNINAFKNELTDVLSELFVELLRDDLIYANRENSKAVTVDSLSEILTELDVKVDGRLKRFNIDVQLVSSKVLKALFP